MTSVETDEKKMFATILNKLDRIEAKLEEMEYPPEEAIREDFIKRVEATERRIKEGKYKKISLQEFTESYSP
jgi:predicted DNA-binding protein